MEVVIVQGGSKRGIYFRTQQDKSAFLQRFSELKRSSRSDASDFNDMVVRVATEEEWQWLKIGEALDRAGLLSFREAR